MKRILSFLLALTMVLGLCACGGSEPTQPQNTANEQNTVDEQNTVAEQAAAEEEELYGCGAEYVFDDFAELTAFLI